MYTACTSFVAYLKELALHRNVALATQRIGALPEPDLEKTLARYRETDEFITIRELILAARPYWHQEKRKQNHARIIKQAVAGEGRPRGWAGEREKDSIRA